MKMSEATPFDTCCLTARIGGTATFTTRLVTRSDVVASELSAPWWNDMDEQKCWELVVFLLGEEMIEMGVFFGENDGFYDMGFI